jgi:hypothetical protein
MATDVSASLPDLILPPGATITVTLDDASAIITKLNVFGFSPARGEQNEMPSLTPVYVAGLP